MEKVFWECVLVLVDLYLILVVLNSLGNVKFMIIYVSWICILEDVMILFVKFCIFM